MGPVKAEWSSVSGAPARTGSRTLAILKPTGVLATMHLAWGVGFLFAPAAGEPQTLAGDDG